jgi:phage terminase large subunit GpA-like protein
MFIIGAGAQNEAAQSAASAQKSFIEERDSVREHWIELIRKRTAGQGLDSWDVETSTIKKDRGSMTLADLDESTRCAVQYACPKCGEFQLLGWAQMRGEWDNPKGARATVRYECALCKSMHTPDEHLAMLRRHRQVSVALDGTVRLELPDVDAYGMRWSSFDSPRKGLLYLATEYARAWVKREKHFNHQAMKQFYRDEASLPYLEEEISFSANRSPTRSSRRSRPRRRTSAARFRPRPSCW